MSHATSRAFLVAIAGAALHAQSTTIADANMSYTVGPLSATSHDPRAASLRADALALDHLFEHWWYYRVAGDTQESSLRDIGPVSRGAAPNGTHLDVDWEDLDARGLLRARLDADVYAAGSASGVVVVRLTMLNLDTNPLTLDVFDYIDADIAGTGSNDNATGDSQRQVVTDMSGVRLEVRAEGADVGQIGVYPTLRTLLTDSGVTTLSGLNTPIQLGDYTGAFQWQNRTLQPGEWQTFSVIFAVDTVAQCPPVVRSFGTGSSAGMEIYTDNLLLQDVSRTRSLDVLLRGARPNALCGLLSNVNRLNGVPFLGTIVWVDLNAPAQFPLRMTDANGRARYTFTVPPSPYLCGFAIHHQWFVDNPQSTTGTADWSAALTTIVGKL